MHLVFPKIQKLHNKIYNEKIKTVKKFSKKAKTNKFAPQPNIIQISTENLEIFKKNK